MENNARVDPVQPEPNKMQMALIKAMDKSFPKTKEKINLN